MQFIGKRYLDYTSLIRSTFGERVQKISIDVGFSCPNRDGSKGFGGCTYCNNEAFSPDYCDPDKSISQQLKEGISFFSKKYKSQQYLAYFQAYTNTYSDIESLKIMYHEALNHPGVIGLVIGTRPDCISEEVIELLSGLSKKYFISLEFGIESTVEETLLKINRCHSFEDSKAAFEMAKNRNIHLGAHLIIGLPGESREDILQHAVAISQLPVQTLKLHQLQIVKQTVMANQYKSHPEIFELFDIENYIDLIVDFIGILRPDIIIERFISESPTALLLAPKWNLKNFEIVAIIDKKLIEKNTWQGKFYKEPSFIAK
jgi:radical SAM protein (TIGR01212 family)